MCFRKEKKEEKQASFAWVSQWIQRQELLYIVYTLYSVYRNSVTRAYS